MKLVVACPECTIEKDLTDFFGSDIRIVSALAGLLELDAFEYAESFNSFVGNEAIEEIIVFVSDQCKVLEDSMLGNSNQNISSFRMLDEIILTNKKELLSLPDRKHRLNRLMGFTLNKEAADIAHSSFVGAKVQEGDILLRTFYKIDGDLVEYSFPNFWD